MTDRQMVSASASNLPDMHGRVHLPPLQSLAPPDDHLPARCLLAVTRVRPLGRTQPVLSLTSRG